MQKTGAWFYKYKNIQQKSIKHNLSFALLLVYTG